MVSPDWASADNNVMRACAVLKRRRAAATVPFVSGPNLTTGGTVRVLLKT